MDATPFEETTRELQIAEAAAAAYKKLKEEGGTIDDMIQQAAEAGADIGEGIVKIIEGATDFYSVMLIAIRLALEVFNEEKGQPESIEGKRSLVYPENINVVNMESAVFYAKALLDSKPDIT